VANIVRPPAAWRRLGVGKSKFYGDFVRPGLLQPVKLGKRATGFFDDELDALIETLRRKRDAKSVEARRLDVSRPGIKPAYETVVAPEGERTPLYAMTRSARRK
jgi:hypothetical protein